MQTPVPVPVTDLCDRVGGLLFAFAAEPDRESFKVFAAQFERHHGYRPTSPLQLAPVQ